MDETMSGKIVNQCEYQTIIEIHVQHVFVGGRVGKAKGQFEKVTSKSNYKLSRTKSYYESRHAKAKVLV